MSRSGYSIRMSHVSVSFPIGRRAGAQRFTALNDITLEIRHGQKLAVIGRNGSGKSTLLRLLAGTISPDTGSVLRNHGPCQLLTLGPGFVPHLSGRDNAVLSALYQGMPYRQIQSRMDAVKAFSELGDFFEQPINTYSSGMRARLGFAVALQLDPDLLLLDEVLGVGDTDFRLKSRRAIQDRLSSDATVVLVSHDEATIRNFCDQAVWIDAGAVRASGVISEVLDAYAGTLPKSEQNS